MDGDRSPSTKPAKLVLHHQPINNQKETADFTKPLAMTEQRAAVDAPEEKLAMKRWRRLFREQAAELDVVRYGGVKHFIAGIPEPPATDESDDNSDLPVAADVDGSVNQVTGTDQLTNLSSAAHAKLVIKFEEVTAASMGKMKAEDVSESCKRVCAGSVGDVGVCEGSIVHVIEEVGVGVGELQERVDESGGVEKAQVEEEKEATGLGAAGKLTGAAVVARQEP
jgi:hypothetical protein